MSRCHNNWKGTWGSHRPDTFSNGSSRCNNVGVRRDCLGLQRPPLDEELSIRTLDDGNNDESISIKLDQLLDRLDKFDSWRAETDRRFDNLEPNPNRRRDQRERYQQHRHLIGGYDQQFNRPATCYDPP